MKDKRQKLAFAWPGYPGDPFSYFSYMYAVAASSGYGPPNQPTVTPVMPPNNPLATAAAVAANARLTATKTRPIPTSQLLNGSTDTVTSSSSASSPTSSSSSPKQNHSPVKPTINFALPAMGLATFLSNAVNESTTST